MTARRLDHALGASVAAVAVLNTLSALSMPVPERVVHPARIFTWLALLGAHAALYWWGERMRARFGLRGYAIAQAVALFAIAAARAPGPLTLALFVACTVEMIVLAGASWGAVRITLGAIVLFVLASLVTNSLYFATTAGLVLAVTGVIAHSLAGLLTRQAPSGREVAPETVAGPPLATPPAGPWNGADPLSPREVDVLRELVGGARNSDIATRLAISEPTVKSHLRSIYQKLGVDSRSAAVSAAIQRKLV
jgi:DNA-binding CsgD family transcriptional regulator